MRILILYVRPRQGSWYLPTHFWTLGVACGERVSFHGPSSSLPANRFKPFWLKMEERYSQWSEGVTWGLVICNANLSVRQPVRPPVPVTSAPSPFPGSQTMLSPHPPRMHCCCGAYTHPRSVYPGLSPPSKLSGHRSTPAPSPTPHRQQRTLSLRQAHKLAASLGCSLPGRFPRLYRWHHREVPQACRSLLQKKSSLVFKP